MNLGLQQRCSAVKGGTRQHDIWFQHNKNSVSGAALRSLWSSALQCWQSTRSGLTAATGISLPSFVIRPRDERRFDLFFGYSGNINCDAVNPAMHQARQKRTFKALTGEILRERRSSENVEQFGYRHLNRAEAKEITPLKARNKHSSASCELHGITKAVNASEKQVATENDSNVDTSDVFKVLFRVPFPSRPKLS